MNNPIEEMNNPKEEMNDPNKNEFKIEKLVRFALDSQVFPKEFENLNEKNLILEKKKIIAEQIKLTEGKNNLEKLRKGTIERVQYVEYMHNEIQEKMALFAKEKEDFLKKYGKEFSNFHKENEKEKNQNKKEPIDIQNKDEVEDIPKEEKEDDKGNCSKIEINEKKDEPKEDEKDVDKKEETKKKKKKKIID